MKILYIGDIMGEVGIEVVEKTLPDLKAKHKVDLTIAQAENVTDGRGISLADYNRLKKIGIDFFTGGNWSLYREEIVQAMNDPSQPIIRPANYPKGTAGLGWKYVETSQGKVLVISLLGKIVGRDADLELDNPLKLVNKILDDQKKVDKAATVVNFHGDFSSEKVIIGHYLDGRVSLVVGDHWHVPTADAQVLPEGTAHISDVGMCGALDASLGIAFSSVLPRWLEGHPTRNVLETKGRRQFNAVLVEVNSQGLAESITPIREILEAKV